MEDALSVALYLDAYEFIDDGQARCSHLAHEGQLRCPDPDDLSDVDLDHPNFRAAFPDGKVPIRHVPSPRLGMGDGFFAWAENLLAIHDATARFDVDRLSELRELVADFTLDNGYCEAGVRSSSESERRALIGEMMRLGLTLRVIARYVGWTEQALLDALTQGKSQLDPEVVFDADELVVEGMSVRAAAASAGLPHHRQLNDIEKLRRSLVAVTPRSDA